MCGITGFTRPGADAHGILLAMDAALGHRGPDGCGTFVDHGIALGHTRLAIVDIAGGAQPRVDHISGDALVFNGEIYGYRALAGELTTLGVPLRDRLVADVPVGVFLSGGLDSSLITAFALKAAPDITAFSVRIGQHSFDETPHAVEVARQACRTCDESIAR